MSRIDPQLERQRLARVYAQMSDLELSELAEDASSLTEMGNYALNTEMASRGMPVRPPLQAGGAGQIAEARPVSGPLALVRRFRDLPEASVARSILESAQIDCFLADENTVRIDWLWSNLVGGFKLMVRPEDQEAALQLLNQGIPESFDAGETEPYVQPSCPHRGSLDVSLEELDRRICYPPLLIGLPVALNKKGWNCHSCRHNWEDPAESDSAMRQLPKSDS